MSKGRKFLKALKVIFITFLLLTVAVIIFLIAYIFGLDQWKNFEPAAIRESLGESLYIYDAEGEEYISLDAGEDRRYISIDDIPLHVQNAFIAIEDARFYSHPGVDPIRIAGALVADIREGSIVQGGSTITQQLIKNTMLTGDQTLERKLNEALMAIKLEQAYSKDDILELYLNSVYFGRGAYGIEAASVAYYNKPASELTIAEGALLAGILKSPSNYAPHIHPDKAMERRSLVLSAMRENGFISASEYAKAIAAPLNICEQEDTYPYGFYTDMVLADACGILGMSYGELQSSGLSIYTALDPTLQQQIETIAKDDSLFPLSSAGESSEGAVVVLRKDGSVAATVGGRDHTARLAFNRATDMRRQPGSAIKPVLVFAPAVEYGNLSPSTLLLDEPMIFGDYSPRNSGNRYRGWTTLRDVAAYSVNIPAVALLEDIGIDRAKNYASSCGIVFDEKDNSLTLALGGFTTGVSPMELAGAYLPLASGGYYDAPYAITKIVSSNGDVLYEKQRTSYSVLSEESAFLVTSMLTSSVEYGTSKALGGLGIPLAAKTGTTTACDDSATNKDAWIVAYNPEYVVCCWVGFDKTDSAHSLEKGVTGGTYPAAIAERIFSCLYPAGKAPDFSVPDGIERVTLDGKQLRSNLTLSLAYENSPDAVTEYFRKGEVPSGLRYIEHALPDDLTVRPSMGVPVITFTADEGVEYVLTRKRPGSEEQTVTTLSGIGKVRFRDVGAPDCALIYRITVEDASGSKSASYLYMPNKAE